MDCLLAPGLTCFIDLTQPGEQPDYAPLLPEGDITPLPLVDHSVPAVPA